MALLPMALYGLEVPPGDVAVNGQPGFPSAFRITMAAIDPSAEPEVEEGQTAARPRATLKVIRLPLGPEPDSDDEDEDDMDIDDMDRQFGGAEDLDDDDDDESSDDEEVNGGPSDPSKSKKAQKAAAQQKINELLDAHGGMNGVVKSDKAKGKMPMSDSDEEGSELDDDSTGMGEIDEFVICTLDPESHYQQPLDITFGEEERIWFKVSGTHTIYLTGNYVEPAQDPSAMFDPDSEDEDEYDLTPDDGESMDSEDESIDELDDMEDPEGPRITEIDEDDVAPALVKSETKKINEKPASKKNKRPAPDSDDAEAGVDALDAGPSLEERIAKEANLANGDKPLSKKEKKKLKNNKGLAVDAPVVAKTEVKVEPKKEAEPSSSAKSDKKVTFASELEQGPTPTKAVDATEKKDDKSKGASVGVKTVQGVTIDDRKLGSGQAAKNGDRVGMRYIGKLQKDGKIFDSNKSGKPFSFKLGSGEVIKGWDIGVAGMQAGGERRITIPAHLAYGSKKTGEIPANSTLQFDIKMLDINKGK